MGVGLHIVGCVVVPLVTPHSHLSCDDPTVSPDIARFPLGTKLPLVDNTALEEEKHMDFKTLNCSL